MVMAAPTENAEPVDVLICPKCSSTIFRLIRDPHKDEEWATCLECDGYTMVKHLEESQDDYDQKRFARK